MSYKTNISWADSTFNPWWGCKKVSQGCKNCYAESWSNRFGNNIWGPDAGRRFFDDKHWNKPLAWNRKAEIARKKLRVFCGSMCDVFEDRPDLVEHRERLYDVIKNTPWLEWMLLTKRPENFNQMWPHDSKLFEYWSPPNVWLGTSIENQDMANERIPHLLRAEAPGILFLSCEPLLHTVSLQYDTAAGPLERCFQDDVYPKTEYAQDVRLINWVIVGGESGPKARHMSLDWARILRDECKILGIPFFMKQLGGKVGNKKENLSDFPRDLRIRELPPY